MASASATTATMAAAGFDKRSSTSSSLLTPGSGAFPSEMMSPVGAGSPSFLKRDELRTPITPPSAYLDFLKNMSPAVLSPAPTSAGTRFTFGEKLPERTSDAVLDRPLASPTISIPTSQASSQATSLPALSRNTSYDSVASSSSNASSRSSISHGVSSITKSSRKRPESPRVIIPPSPFAKPGQPSSARTPRNPHLPASPFSQPPCSAQSVPSPYSITPASATPWNATCSPRDHDIEPMSKPGKVSVRQVVTRTVTYCRTPVDPTPLDPAPRGKRRKIDIGEDDRGKQLPPISSIVDMAHIPPIKEEQDTAVVGAAIEPTVSTSTSARAAVLAPSQEQL